MAGNANSGRDSRKSLGDLITKAATRAIKQGASRGASLDLALERAMQEDPLGFLKAVSPYVPKEIVIDHSISILAALDDAKSRIISMRESVVASLPSEALTDTVPITIDSIAERVDDSQGG